MSAMDKSKIKREICDRITKLSYKRPKTEKEHNMIYGAKIELEDLLETIRASEGKMLMRVLSQALIMMAC